MVENILKYAEFILKTTLFDYLCHFFRKATGLNMR